MELLEKANILFRIIVVDGRRLGQRYELTPFKFNLSEERSQEDDMEERLISTENVISNFTNYILEAHLLIPEETVCHNADTLEQILKLAKKRGVKLKVHNDVKNMSWTYLKNHDETKDLSNC